ncbi:MAG: hypothetical protein FJY95_11145 [Candidatus Handelsmanbacteria bacterium]|nr:hypothetical protein [Candidatus Handelsmanbacteria bacterium]
MYVIDPAGPDTLARAHYQLDRDPDQSLCWPAKGGPPTLHGQWPGRDLFSPGRPQPLLQTLSLDPPCLLLAAGERAQLAVVGPYSDGLQRELWLVGQWYRSATRVATLRGQGLVAAADTGRTRIRLQLDTFTASCKVAVQHPLPKRLEFSPSGSASPPRPACPSPWPCARWPADPSSAPGRSTSAPCTPAPSNWCTVPHPGSPIPSR